MRITESEIYSFHDDAFHCDLWDCRRNYCQSHRYLWRDCESVKVSMMGDRDLVGGSRQVEEIGDCPKCEREERTRRYQAYAGAD